MARKSKIEPVRKFLEKARNVMREADHAYRTAEKLHDVARKERDARDAEIYKTFTEILENAIKLCGAK